MRNPRNSLDDGVSEYITQRNCLPSSSSKGGNDVTEVYAFRIQSDEAFEWLDRAYARHDSGIALTSLDLQRKNLHSDPRCTYF